MKKIFSTLVVLCMLVSTTAFALTSDAVATFTADKTTATVGDTINFSVKISADSGTAVIAGAALTLTYDATLLEIDTKNATYGTVTGYSTKSIRTSGNDDTKKRLMLQNNCATGRGDVPVAGAQTMFTFTGKVLKPGTITFTPLNDASAAISLCDPVVLTDTYRATFASFPSIVASEASSPSFTIDESTPITGENNGIVDIDTNNTTGAYSVNVTAPIGKKAVIYINGVAQPGTSISGTATAATTIKVEYEDVTDDVITYVVPMEKIYGSADGIAAFGKGTITDENVAYGIKFGGFTDTPKAFSANGNANGIFAVEIKDAKAGNYTAQAYVGDANGAVISFTK